MEENSLQFIAAKVVILVLFIFTIKSIVVSRPLDDKKTSNDAKKMSYQENRGFNTFIDKTEHQSLLLALILAPTRLNKK